MKHILNTGSCISYLQVRYSNSINCGCSLCSWLINSKIEYGDWVVQFIFSHIVSPFVHNRGSTIGPINSRNVKMKQVFQHACLPRPAHVWNWRKLQAKINSLVFYELGIRVNLEAIQGWVSAPIYRWYSKSTYKRMLGQQG